MDKILCLTSKDRYIIVIENPGLETAVIGNVVIGNSGLLFNRPSGAISLSRAINSLVQ